MIIVSRTRFYLGVALAGTLSLHFAFAESAPLRITAGAAPSSLVARYVVTWSAGPSNGKAATFGADGGVLDDDLPVSITSIKVDFAVDFTTDSKLPSFVYHVDQPVNGNAVNLIYKPMMKAFGLVAELPKHPCRHDNILVQWSYTVGGRMVSFEQLTTFSSGPRSNTFSTDLPFLFTNIEPTSVAAVVSGKFRGKTLGPTSFTFTDAVPALVFKVEKGTGPEAGWTLVNALQTTHKGQ